MLAICSHPIPVLADEVLNEWLGPAFSSILNPESKEAMAFKLSRRQNREGKAHKTNLWVTFQTKEAALHAVRHHEEFYQPDVNGSLTWKLTSKHLTQPTVQPEACVKTAGDNHGMCGIIPAFAIRASQYFSYCSNMTAEDIEYPPVSMLDRTGGSTPGAEDTPVLSDQDMPGTPQKRTTKRSSIALIASPSQMSMGSPPPDSDADDEGQY